VVKFQPLGAINVTDVIAYPLVDGLVTASLRSVGVSCRTRVGVVFMVGRLAFPAACAGTANGTKNSIPESASNASIVPELNLLKYIEDVFIFSEQVTRNQYIKRVDELSIIQAVLG
jgi:hypothetical protein